MNGLDLLDAPTLFAPASPVRTTEQEERIPMAKKKQTVSAGSHVIDRISGRLIVAGPEEVDATQPLLEALVDEAGWKPEQIASRPQWKVPPSPSGKREWPVDVAIFDGPTKLRDPAHVRILCECKRPDESTGIEQLKIYMGREPHARVGIWFNGIDHAILYKTNDDYIQAPAGTPLPTPRDPYGPVGSRVLTRADLRKAPSLVPVFRRIRDRLATLDSNVNRDEEILPDISLLLLMKILDEQSHQHTKNPMGFQIDADVGQTAERMKKLLATEVSRNPSLFGVNSHEPRFQIDDDSLYYVVQTLQNYQLLSNEEDAIAEAFQVIRGKAYKGEEGQYFTPPSVVNVAVAAVNPKPDNRIIDPACGSGSFLAAVLRSVEKHFERVHPGNPEQVRSEIKSWSNNKLFAIDKDSVSVRLSKAYLSMLGDGSTHVFKSDAIRFLNWSSQVRGAIKEKSFDVVVTNPPFGTKLKVSPSIGREENFELSRDWVHDETGWRPGDDFAERDLGLIFLEKSIRLLNDGGRLAIVLPDTYLFSDSYAWLVQWLSQFTITHSINVPIEAFEPHCRAKTSIIVIKKSKPSKTHQIIGSLCETYGEDKHGRPRFRLLDGKETGERDDEMADAAKLFRSSARPGESKLHFRFNQAEAIERGVLVASYWWRKPYQEALESFAAENDCDLVSIGELIDDEEIQVMPGHGSPKSHFKGRGTVPYIKVTDIKNWRIIENPKYFIPDNAADSLRRARPLKPFDLVTPTRASKNIGLFAVVMPWQTQVVMTREIYVWRVADNAKRIDNWLLLALMSLKVVNEQFRYVVLMQMNREDLSERYREVQVPIPKSKAKREQWAAPIRDFFTAQATARESYDNLKQHLDPTLFADRP